MNSINKDKKIEVRPSLPSVSKEKEETKEVESSLPEVPKREIGDGKKQSEEKPAVSGQVPVAPVPSVSQEDHQLKEIENILEEDLKDLYQDLPPDKKIVFKEKGEATARQINLLLKGVKVKVKEILRLIIDWLKIIPGINKYFLEQEAKIKTDRIIAEHQDKEFY